MVSYSLQKKKDKKQEIINKRKKLEKSNKSI